MADMNSHHMDIDEMADEPLSLLAVRPSRKRTWERRRHSLAKKPSLITQSTGSSGINWSRAPEFVLAHVVPMLDSLEVVLSVARVCSLWRTSAQNALNAITIHGRDGISNVSVLQSWRALRRLIITDCLPNPGRESFALIGFGSLPLLTTLILDLSRFDDLSLLRKCVCLTHLSISYCPVDDVSPLQHCPALQVLNLSHTRVDDVSPLRECIALHTLNLKHTFRTTSVVCLEDLPALTDLNLDSDIGAIGRFVHLQTLSLQGSYIETASALAQCTALRRVLLANSEMLWDVSGLASCGSLKYLSLAGCHAIADIGCLSECSQLEELDLSGIGNDALGWHALGACASLTHLNMLNCGSREMIEATCGLWTSPLRQLSIDIAFEEDELEEMGDSDDGGGTAIVTHLHEETAVFLTSSMPASLTHLTIHHAMNQVKLEEDEFCAFLGFLFLIESLPQLRNNLQSLTCRQICGSPLDISPLASLRVIQALDFSLSSALYDITPLSQCPSLLHLDLSETNVGDIRPLQYCTSLQRLFLQRTRVRQIDVLSQCRQLAQLNVNDTKVKSIEALEECFELEEVYIENTRVSDLSWIATDYHSHLHTLDVSDCSHVVDLSSLLPSRSLRILGAKRVASSVVQAFRDTLDSLNRTFPQIRLI